MYDHLHVTFSLPRFISFASSSSRIDDTFFFFFPIQKKRNNNRSKLKKWGRIYFKKRIQKKEIEISLINWRVKTQREREARESWASKIWNNFSLWIHIYYIYMCVFNNINKYCESILQHMQIQINVSKLNKWFALSHNLWIYYCLKE